MMFLPTAVSDAAIKKVFYNLVQYMYLVANLKTL